MKKSKKIKGKKEASKEYPSPETTKKMMFFGKIRNVTRNRTAIEANKNQMLSDLVKKKKKKKRKSKGKTT